MKYRKHQEEQRLDEQLLQGQILLRDHLLPQAQDQLWQDQLPPQAQDHLLPQAQDHLLPQAQDQDQKDLLQMKHLCQICHVVLRVLTLLSLMLLQNLFLQV
jgi:hypothetical protein